MSSSAADFAALKTRLKTTWMDGDFGQIAKYSEAAAEAFIARQSITSGQRLLDVACGTGNLTIPAAHAGAAVTGCDIATNLLEQARARAQAAGLTIRFDDGDAEELPYPDAAFDLVVSQFGVMFAPRPDCVAAELVRVCRPGGRIALGNWTPGGFIGQIFKLNSQYLPPPPGVLPPVQWGDESIVRERLRDGIAELKMTRAFATLRYPFSVPETVEFYRSYYGPTRRAFAALSEAQQASLRADLERLWSQHNRATDGTTAVEAEYLEIVALRANMVVQD